MTFPIAISDRSFALAIDAVFLAFAFPIAVVDVREFRVPDRLVYPAIALVLALRAAFRLQTLPMALIAALVAALFLLAVRAITRGLGLGDVKFGLFMGAYLGLEATFPAFLFASLAGLTVALPLLFARRLSRATPIPFAPFLACGALASRFLAPPLSATVERLLGG